MSVVLFSFLTFIAAPLGLFGVAVKYLGRDTIKREHLLMLVFPLGPTAISLLTFALYCLPLPHIGAINIALVMITATFGILVGRREIFSLISSAYKNIYRKIDLSIVWIMAVSLIFIACAQILALPMMENDSLEYMAVARHIFESGTISVYPVVESASKTGLFAPSSHPPAYHMMLVWAYTFTGVDTFVGARLLSLFHLLGTICLLRLALINSNNFTLAAAIILLLGTPLYMSMVVGYHVDGLRLMAFFAAAISIAWLVEHPTRKIAVFAGIVVGFAAYTHSIGLLVVPFACLACLLLVPEKLQFRIKLCIVICSIAALVGGLQYIRNIWLFGVPLQDTTPVWEMAQIDFLSDLRYRRDLLSFEDKLVFGMFRSFVETHIFGALFWLLGVVALRACMYRSFTILEKVCLLWVCSFFAIALLTISLGSELVVKNARYVLTLAPLVAYLVASSLGTLGSKLHERG